MEKLIIIYVTLQHRLLLSLFLLLPLLLCSQSVIKVTQGEYYIDSDPGAGNATPMNALDGNFSDAFETVVASLTGLSAGNHSIGIRVKDADNHWSPVFRTSISVMSLRTIKLNQAEYYIDVNPAQGSGSPMFAFNNNFTEAFETVTASLSSLSAGNHMIGIRVKDVENHWSPDFKCAISVIALRDIRLAQSEYFWDADPGQGNGTPMFAFDGTYSDAIENSIATIPAAPHGIHKLSMRVKDDEGHWSPLFSQVVVAGWCDTIHINASATAICSGTNVIFTANYSSLGGTPSFQWKLNGANVGTNLPTYSSNGLVNGDVVSCLLTTQSGCTDEPQTSNAITITVSFPDSLAIFPASPVSLCYGDSVLLTASAGFTTYLWSNEASTQYIYVKTPGTYMVTAGNVSGCTTTAMVQATVNPLPYAYAGTDQSILANTTIMDATATNGTGTWSVLNGTGAFANVNSNTTTVNNISMGMNRYRWVVSNGLCADDADTVKVYRMAGRIVAAEYFFDTDPGVGAGTALSVGTFTDSVNFSAIISTIGLSHGAFHMLYIRTKDEKGKWSLIEGRLFYIKAQIIAAEYFFDTDPGWGKTGTTPIFISDPADLVNFSVNNISTSGLASGYHFLYVRTRDELGKISLHEGRQFFIYPSLFAAEYFFDTDPGVGKGIDIPITLTVDSLNFSLSDIPTTNLGSGYHWLHIRTKDETGKWSLYEPRRFYVKGHVVTAEYFVDTDPGVGNGIGITVPTPSDNINLTTSITPPPLPEGNHLAYLRTKDNTNNWSNYEGRQYYQCGFTTSIQQGTDVTICQGNNVQLNTTETQNYSMQFNGINDYVSIPNSTAYSSLTDFTLEAWFRANVFTTTYDIVGYENNTGVRMEIEVTANSIIGWVNGTSFIYSTPINTNQWYHVAMTRQGTSVKIYLNGNLVPKILF